MLRYFSLFCLMMAAESICPQNYQLIQENCFRFMKTNTYWSNAKLQCANENATLAIINDCEVFSYLVRYIHFNNLEVPDGSFYWIGASDTSMENNWVWVDGSSVDMGAPFWGSLNGNYQPDNGGGGEFYNEDCAYLDKADQYYFHDGDCLSNGWFICQANPLMELEGENWELS